MTQEFNTEKGRFAAVTIKETNAAQHYYIYKLSNNENSIVKTIGTWPSGFTEEMAMQVVQIITVRLKNKKGYKNYLSDKQYKYSFDTAL